MSSSLPPVLRKALVAGTAIGLAAAGAAARAAEFATVISSTPVVASVPVARQSCSEGRQYVQQAPTGAGAVIGAIAGGVLGHSVGGGFGQAAATGIGAVVGSAVGNNVEASTSPVTEVPVRRCRSVSAYEDRTVGYEVMYEYAGQRYSTRMARDPGAQLAVNVQPADRGNAGMPTPAAADPAPPLVESAPQPVYYQPAPAYYYDAGPSVYVAPVIGFGFGYYGGYRGRHRWR